MTVSNVALVNRALQILGTSETIESLTEDSGNARSMNRALEPRRRALLRKFRWGFAIKRKSQAADGSQTAFGGLNRYALPNDFLRLLRDVDLPDYRKDWRREGRYIVTADDSPLEFRYIADITDPTQWDALFYEALAHDLAHETCHEITGSTGKKQDIREDMKDIIAEARKIGSIEEDPTEPLDDDWVLARL